MKELHLQQLSFVIAGLYAVAFVGLSSMRGIVEATQGVILPALTALTTAALTILTGSVASAEERHLDTLEWHALFPMRAWVQWAVKALVVTGVAVLLGIGVPVLLASAAGSREMSGVVRSLLSAGAVLAVIFVSLLSLYVSSLCSTSLQAMLWSVAVCCGLLQFLGMWVHIYGVGFLPGVGPSVLSEWTSTRMWDNQRAHVLWMAINGLNVAFYAGVLALLLRFGSGNHRFQQPGYRRLFRQTASIAAYTAVVMSLLFGVHRAFEARTSHHGDWIQDLATITGPRWIGTSLR